MDWQIVISSGILIIGGAAAGFILRGVWDRRRRRRHIRAMPNVWREAPRQPLAFPDRPLIPTKPAGFCAGGWDKPLWIESDGDRHWSADHSEGRDIQALSEVDRVNPLIGNG
jgi:hypothetical protein